MTDRVQKIREWVKSRLDENASKQSLPQFYGMMEEDARFLDFLDSLQEEPVSEDLVKCAEETRKKLRPLFESYSESKGGISAYDQDDMLTMFKAGAKWQLNKIKEKYEKNRD